MRSQIGTLHSHTYAPSQAVCIGLLLFWGHHLPIWADVSTDAHTVAMESITCAFDALSMPIPRTNLQTKQHPTCAQEGWCRWQDGTRFEPSYLYRIDSWSMGTMFILGIHVEFPTVYFPVFPMFELTGEIVTPLVTPNSLRIVNWCNI